MSFGRVYNPDVLEAMQSLVAGKTAKINVKVKLLGREYAGTKVMPFRTFGVTAALEINGKIFMGTGVAPMATSGGVREPQSSE